MSDKNQAAAPEKKETEITLIQAMAAMVQAIKHTAIIDSRCKDELLIVETFIDQNTPADTDDETDDE